ncbi:hydrolase 1, exosortase A system-associated [Hephaestia mangrovi]|uniref:hydrolase 1, exosortase A system-associated n=1 Tax=Hephaestia mangrovi TaxID=2873268 RepID=UPI001CA711FE|nr:hydrolase 1, exosortase A system-associated [Hephaestia mangrovi]MBY8827073.1 hydrolase 1, exosortase A system-associated [Hephaestia mangrovi]
MRELIAFDCASDTLLGTLDTAEGKTGVLIVSGGNEIRIGAHRGMASLAARLAAAGIPVFRFDRRGIGDSSGENGGYASSGPDIAAAAAAFREHAPSLEHIVGFGNCDAATALVLFGREAGIDRLILSNPWVIEPADDLPPAAAIRARYAERLRDPREWRRLLTGGVNIGKLFNGLMKIAARSGEDSGDLATRFFSRLPRDTTVILAARDATAQAFAAEAERRRWPGAIVRIDTASHSYARTGDADALAEAIARVC